VALGRYPYSGWLGALSDEDRRIIDWAMEVTGIGSYAQRKTGTLSDGESQKVMLARALAQDTPLMMLDEPTAHLDLPSRIQLMQLLHKLARQTKKASFCPLMSWTWRSRWRMWYGFSNPADSWKKAFRKTWY